MELNPLNAADPYRNATVSASAGTGKTWMLTTRIVRLLLADAPPASILAITFTRKAAGEMRQRVSDRLKELSQCSDEERGELLAMMGVEVNAETLDKARQLYTRLLAATDSVRISTFHSFCQDILRGFPMEADVPAGFELLQQTGLAMDMAWEQLIRIATDQPDGELAQALDYLFEALNTLYTTKSALYRFVDQRTDWWAYTEGQEQPVEWAIEQLQQQLDAPSEPWFLISQLDTPLATFNEQLGLRKPNATTGKFQAAIGTARLSIDEQQYEQAFEVLCSALLTKDFKPRAYKHTGVLDKELKGLAADHVALFNDICSHLLRTRESLLRQQALELNTAWYQVGQQLIDCYQQLKEQRRQLDFGDLEWKTYQLLHHGDNADWVQYKLDQRINHLLFDEFQDTNPTQWQLVRPLLEELAAGEQDRHRSVFLVGDIKQSIYSFRRANPDLQVQASEWLQSHLQASDFPLNLSRRSSPTVINAVNHVFELESFKQQLPSFSKHGTYQQKLWGRFELHPLVTSPKPEEVEIIAGENLRNPLEQPRIDPKRDHHYQEGLLIGRRIQALIKGRIAVEGEDGERAIDYGDIYILLRSRSHVADYERALRSLGIPYLGTEKGTFLDNMEISDMDALLNFLNMPFDNHRLATILRSPLFHVSSQDLIELAKVTEHKNWWDRLCHIVDQNGDTATAPLKLARERLSDWLALTPQLPVHDLLDHIYHTGEVLQRYSGAVKPEKADSTRANLIRFLEMALEMDSGRYPSLTRFLDQLKRLRKKDSATDKPDNAETSGHSQRVQFLTIHASKGLEAPVVFLADCFGGSNSKEAWSPMVEWPSDQDRPSHFMLTPRKDDLCETHQQLVDKKEQRDAVEAANLLYVALTRAKHMLVVTGSCREEIADKDSKDWYQLIRQGLEPHCEPDDQGVLILKDGTPQSAPQDKTAEPEQAALDIAPAFDWSPVPAAPTSKDIAPSRLDKEYEGGSGDPHAMERGNYIHQLLEGMTQPHPFTVHPAKGLPEPIRIDCEAEAKAVLSAPALDFLFNPQCYTEAKKEVGLQYHLKDDQYVYGIIDRLVVTEDEVIIVDYKTHQHINADNVTGLAEHYRQQLDYYRQGIADIYPDKSIRMGVLFTHNQQWVEL